MMETKDCPFCGSDKVYPSSDTYKKWSVWCWDCHAEGPKADTEEKAIKLWNRRK